MPIIARNAWQQKIMVGNHGLDGEKDQKPLFRYEKMGAQRS